MSAPMSRRAFLGRSGLMLGGAALLGAGVLARPPRAAGAPWPQPDVRASSGGRLSTRLLVAETDVEIAGQTARALTYEGSYPGPTLDLRAGEELAVELANTSGQVTNLHTHGLHVSPRQPADDVLLDIEPGGAFQYRYAIAADHPGGTYWYHAHRHMLTDNQVFGGLFGMLVIRGALDELPGVAGLEERALLFSQMEIVDGRVAAADRSLLANQVTLVNGRLRPTLELETGQTQRWRLVNTSSVFLRLRLDGHALDVIAVDGNALEAPSSRRVLEIPPGGRADVLVRAREAGDFALRSLSWERYGVFYSSMVPVPQVVARVRVRGRTEARPDPLPAALLPFESLEDAPIDRRRVWRLEEREPRGTGRLDDFRYFINGELFDATKVTAEIPLGSTEEWTIRNLTYEPHPIHIHVNPFQVVAIDGRPSGERHLRDSALVPPFGSITIRHRFLDFTGVYPMHCHILFHEDHGMMTLLEVHGPEGPQGPPAHAVDGHRHH